MEHLVNDKIKSCQTLRETQDKTADYVYMQKRLSKLWLEFKPIEASSDD